MKDFFSKCDQARRNLQILSHLQTKSLMESLIFWAVVLNLTLKNYPWMTHFQGLRLRQIYRGIYRESVPFI